MMVNGWTSALCVVFRAHMGHIVGLLMDVGVPLQSIQRRQQAAVRRQQRAIHTQSAVGGRGWGGAGGRPLRCRIVVPPPAAGASKFLTEHRSYKRAQAEVPYTG